MAPSTPTGEAQAALLGVPVSIIDSRPSGPKRSELVRTKAVLAGSPSFFQAFQVRLG